MARSGARIQWDNPIPKNLAQVPEFVDKAVATTMRFYEPQAESYARTNAPWQDQTGNARSGLIAASGKEGRTHVLVLAHQVPYGIWLEVRFAARNAIILPTLEIFGPKIMNTVQKILDRFGG